MVAIVEGLQYHWMCLTVNVYQLAGAFEMEAWR